MSSPWWLEPPSGAALLLAERALLALASLASLLGCALILATWKRVAGPNYLSRRIITSLGLSGLLSALAFAASTLVDGLGAAFARHAALCYLQALALQFFYLASYLWTACFAFHLFQIIVRRNEYPEKLLWIYRCVAWGVPGVQVVFLVLRQLTGHIGVGPADRRWCWIAVHVTAPVANETSSYDPEWSREGAVQQLLLFYVPIALVFVFNAAVYWQILRYLAADPMAGKFRNKVVLYLSIFFLCSIWGAINRAVQFQRADHAPNAFLTLMECVCDPLQPLLNAVAYGINKRALDAYRDRICCASNPTSISHSVSWWNAWMHSPLPSSGDEDEEEDLLPLVDVDDAESPASRDPFLPSSSLLENDQLAPIFLSPPQRSQSSNHHDHLDQEFAQYFLTPRRPSGRSKRASRR